jgi:hypothetical protein
MKSNYNRLAPKKKGRRKPRPSNLKIIPPDHSIKSLPFFILLAGVFQLKVLIRK